MAGLSNPNEIKRPVSASPVTPVQQRQQKCCTQKKPQSSSDQRHRIELVPMFAAHPFPLNPAFATAAFAAARASSTITTTTIKG